MPPPPPQKPLHVPVSQKLLVRPQTNRKPAPAPAIDVPIEEPGDVEAGYAEGSECAGVVVGGLVGHAGGGDGAEPGDAQFDAAGVVGAEEGGVVEVRVREA